MENRLKAGALFQLYTDGSVLVTHGGVEMGQGLHTKIVQIAVTSFSSPLSSLFISETSTDKVPKASPTTASASSDLYGQAVLNACEEIKSRMKPVAEKGTFSSFAKVFLACDVNHHEPMIYYHSSVCSFCTSEYPFVVLNWLYMLSMYSRHINMSLQSSFFTIKSK